MRPGHLELRAAAGARVERVAAPLLAVAFFREDRPLRGDAGLADWRLCGRLSRLLAGGRLGGGGSAAALLTTGGRLRAPVLLVREMGSRRGFGLGRVREAASGLVASALRAGFRDVALSPPGGWLEPGAEPGALFRATLLGAAGALAEQGGPLRLALVGIGPADLASVLDAATPELAALPVAVELAGRGGFARTEPGPPGPPAEAPTIPGPAPGRQAGGRRPAVEP